MLETVIQSIPRTAGSYLLWLVLSQDQILSVGRLGTFHFAAGDTLYMGSAHGPGGLRARLGRHLRGSGKMHWHIDYLRAAARVCGFGWRMATPGSVQGLECRWSQVLAAQPGASLPVPGFGASDCRAGCSAHLVHFPGGVRQNLARITSQTDVNLRII